MSFSTEVLSKLGRLKNTKKRLANPPLLEQMEQAPEYDVSGTQTQNVPIPDYEAGGLTPESYDVRANEVIDPEFPTEFTNDFGQPEEENIYEKIGQNLAYSAFGQSPEFTQVEKSEGLPIQQPPELEQPVLGMEQTQEEPQRSSILSQLGDYLRDYSDNALSIAAPAVYGAKEYGGPLLSAIGRGLKNYYEYSQAQQSPEAMAAYKEKYKDQPSQGLSWPPEDATERNRQLIESGRMKAAGITPEIQQKQQDLLKQQVIEAQKNPMENVVYGATDLIAQTPEIQQNFKTYTGIDYKPIIAEQTKNYEKVLSDMENNNIAQMAQYDEQLRSIKERIDQNNATDMDKFYIGLALLMPVLAGAFFGKEAALGALSGGAQGMANIYQKRAEGTRKDEEMIMDINKLKSEADLRKNELDLKRLQYPSEITQNLPKDPNEFLKGKSVGTITDPQTGEQLPGILVKPGLVAKPEFLASKDDLKDMNKQAEEINKIMVPAKSINKVTDDIIYLSQQLKDPSIFTKAIQNTIAGKKEAIRPQFGQEIEFEGRKVNSAVALQAKIEALVDNYRKVNQMRALTGQVQSHVDSLFSDPTASFLTPRDTIDQMLFTRDLIQNQVLDTAEMAGFYPQLIAQEFGASNRNVYGRLNKQEGIKESQQLLRE